MCERNGFTRTLSPGLISEARLGVIASSNSLTARDISEYEYSLDFIIQTGEGAVFKCSQRDCVQFVTVPFAGKLPPLFGINHRRVEGQFVEKLHLINQALIDPIHRFSFTGCHGAH